MSNDELTECYNNCAKRYNDNPAKLQDCYAVCNAVWKGRTKRDLIKSGANTGYIGSILTLAVITSVFGIPLVLSAMRRLSKAYRNKAMWKGALYATITFYILFIFAIAVNRTGNLNGVNYASIYNAHYVIYDVIGYIFILIYGWFMKNAFNELRKMSDIEHFGRAALLNWIGAILTIVVVGIILIWISYLYAMLGFRKLKNLQ